MSFTRIHEGYVIIVAQTPDAAWAFSLLEIDRCPETVNHAFSTFDLKVLIAHILDVCGEDKGVWGWVIAGSPNWNIQLGRECQLKCFK